MKQFLSPSGLSRSVPGRMSRAVAPIASPLAFERLPQPALAAARITLGPWIAAAFTGAYVVRASLAAYVGSESSMWLVAQGSVVAVAVACAYVLAGGAARVNWWGVAFVLAGAASLRNCEAFDFALVHWLGWALMVATVGPVNNSGTATRFRASTWAMISAAFVVATLASIVWWAAGMPNLGRGDFTGVMWHSMTLGPLAAITGLMAVTRAASGGALAWYGVFGVATVVATLASSRSALAAMACGVAAIIVLKLKRRPIVSSLALALIFAAALAPEASLEALSNVLPETLTSGLARKSWDNSRETHWQARWDEFCWSPLTGVGFATGWEDTAGYNDETGAIETGSSYLSILSMTGGVGAAAFLLLVSSTAYGVWRHWGRLSSRAKLETASLAAFWSVHLGAEGYIYAVSSLMGLTFWLWLGRLGDQLHPAPTRAVRHDFTTASAISPMRRHLA